MWFVAAVIAVILAAVIVGLLTRQPPFQCPPGKSIALTVKRHRDAGAAMVVLEAARIDTAIAEETAKSFWRRFPALLFSLMPWHEPPGPWHVLVATDDLPEAQRLLNRGHGA